MRARPFKRHVARGLAAGGVVYGLLALLATARGADLPAPAQGYTVSDEGAFTLERMSVSDATAARLLRVWQDAAARVEAALGLAIPPRPHAILAPTDAEFERRLAALGAEPGTILDTALAVAFSGKNVIVFRERGIAEGTPAGLELTLGHELGHLALGRLEAARGERLPRWLNEGLSEWASGHRPDRGEALELGGWALHDELPSLEALAEAFPPHGTGRAYLVALGAVTWIDAQQGGGGVRRLLEALAPRVSAEGATLDEAVRAATGVDLAAAEVAWHAALIADYSLLESLLRSVTVWMIIGVLALLAVLRHMWVRRRKLRALDAADAVDAAPGPGPGNDAPAT